MREGALGAVDVAPGSYSCPECRVEAVSVGAREAACESCGWVSPHQHDVPVLIASPDVLNEQEFYESEYARSRARPPLNLEAVESAWNSLKYPVNRDVRAALPDLRGKAVLLLGNGTSEKEFGFLLDGPSRLVVSDLAPAAVADARARFIEWRDPGHTEFVALDGQRLPLADQSFDVVYGYAFVHHLPDLPSFLRETYRVLRPGGRCVFMDNGYSPIWQALKLSVLRPLMLYFHRREMISPEDLRATLTGWYRESELADQIVATGGRPFFVRSSFVHYLVTRAAERLPPQPVFYEVVHRPRTLRFLMSIDRVLHRSATIRANEIRLVWGFDKP